MDGSGGALTSYDDIFRKLMASSERRRAEKNQRLPRGCSPTTRKNQAEGQSEDRNHRNPFSSFFGRRIRAFMAGKSVLCNSWEKTAGGGEE
ncbi:unnamed protein product [Victoria cruziana]